MHQCFNIIQKNNQKLQTEAWETCSSFKSMPCTFSKQKWNIYLSEEICISENNLYVKTTQNSLQPQTQQAHRTQPVAAPHQGSGSCSNFVPLWVCCAKLQRESKSSTAQTQQHDEHKGQTICKLQLQWCFKYQQGLQKKHCGMLIYLFIYPVL